MDNNSLIAFFGWCSIINIFVFVYWAGVVLLAPKWIYRHSSAWFDFSEQQFSAIQYVFLGAFKLFIIFFNLVPYIVLRIIFSS